MTASGGAPTKEPTDARGSATAGGSPGMRHYIHPTDPEKMWCGCPRLGGTIGDPEAHGEKPDCVVCVDLRAMYGVSGWVALRDGVSP